MGKNSHGTGHLSGCGPTTAAITRICALIVLPCLVVEQEKLAKAYWNESSPRSRNSGVYLSNFASSTRTKWVINQSLVSQNTWENGPKRTRRKPFLTGTA